jgi:protein gp37
MEPCHGLYKNKPRLQKLLCRTGCKNCYAERMANRLQAMGQPNYRKGFKIAVHPGALNLPLNWRRPQKIFVNSMSDLFHDSIPFPFVRKITSVMHKADWHLFQILTKRSEYMLSCNNNIFWAANMWLGVTVETAAFKFRIDHLRASHAKHRFISFEPLLGPVGKLNLTSIDWVIVGGESGPYARPMAREWVLEIRDQCLKAKVPFFFKQWGGFLKKKNGRMLEGRIYDEEPVALQCLQ